MTQKKSINMRLNRNILLAAAITLAPTLGRAAEAVPAESDGGYNIVLISLVSLIVTLLLVIGVLAGTLSQLGVVVKDKIRKDKANRKNLVKALLVLIAVTVSGGAFAQEAQEAAVQGPVIISGMAENDFYLIMGTIALELIVIFALVGYIHLMLRLMKGIEEPEEAAVKAPEKSWFWDKFNSAVSVEKEKDMLLDHNYDGIRELDNSLPPWWKYGFYLTIVIGIIYLYRFHISHQGPSSQEEFIAEMEKGEADKAAYLAKSANNVDEGSVTMLVDAAALASGKDLFVKNCAACHLADGGGSVGPNLTDEYWIHGGSIKDVFKSIKYGWQEKGMKSWKDDFSPKQIQELASFVKSLKGTTPATAKEKQGELYIEAGAPADSTAAPADTTGSAK
jgi:cytochrome c oxidase cbb3-type subunit III